MVTQADSKADVIQRIQQARQQLASLGVRSVGLFGSFVRDEQTPSSDIDVLVEFVPEKHTCDIFMEVAFLLEELFGRRVEMVTPEALSPHIGAHVLREVERVPVAA